MIISPSLLRIPGGFLAVCLAAVSQAAQGSSFPDRVPGDACFALFAPDVGQACRAFEKTRLGVKLTGPDFAPLIKELRRLNQPGPMNLRPTFGLDWSDLVKVRDPGGFAVFPLADRSVASAWLFIPAKATTQIPACLVAAERYFTEQGYRKSAVRQGDAALTVFAPPATHKLKSSPTLLVGKGFYGVANSQTAAEALIKLKPDQSLAAQEAFKKFNPTQTGDAPENNDSATFFVRPLELWELVRQPTKNPPDDASEPEAPDRLAQARRLGAESMRSIAGRLIFRASEPCEWQVQANLLAPRPYRSAMRMLDFQAGALPAIPRWISAEIASAWFWRWDFSTAMKGFGNWFDEANQPGPDGEGLFEDMLDGLRDDPEGVHVDLRRDLFEQLNPEVLRVRLRDSPATPSADGTDEGRWLFVANVRDLAMVGDALNRFYKGDKRVTHARLGNYDLWTVPEGESLFVEGQSTSLVTLRALAVGDGRLLFGPDVDLVKSTIADGAQGPALSDDAAWSQLLDWMKKNESPQTALRGLMRLDDVLHASYQSATTEKTADSDSLLANLWRLFLFGTTEQTHDLPYSAAPKFDRLGDALPPSALFMSQTDDGWTIVLGALGAQTARPK